MNNNSRTKNTIRNIVWNLIDKVITIFFSFILRAIIIRKLSAEYLGLNSLFTSILQVLNLTELGFSNAVVFSMYKPIAENDKDTICALMNLYKKVYRIIGIVILIIGLILVPFLGNFIKDEFPREINITLIYLIYLSNTVLTYFLFAYKNALLVAHQRADISKKINTITYFIQYILQIIILLTIKNYYIYLIFIIVRTIINNLVCSNIVNKQYPEYICKGRLSKEFIEKMKKSVVGIMIKKICGTTRNSLDSIFISMFLGLNMVAIYNNYYLIMHAIVTVLGIFTNSMIASVGNSIATESVEKNSKDMFKFNYIYMWIAGVCTVCLLCLYQPVMELWMGTEYLFPYSIVILFCIYFYVLAMGDIRHVYENSAGVWWEGKGIAIIETIANVILNYILGKYLGIYGIIIGTVLSLFIINFGYKTRVVFKYYFKNKNILKYFGRHFIYALTTAVSCFITYYACYNIPNINQILRLIIIGIFSLSIPNIIYFIVYNKMEEFKEAKIFIINIINKKILK